ncbi:transmembrane and coiled-coil domain-containing protein 4-like isoform X1 [Gossypium australe]|uniref:Transmembrane and coiled-coil domain-containing protein 4-like isoform X1 n=1 Tax=Gossypium australe TaxID=47621 RepID=A0A5B6WUE6_9ROSI|nr:transmembrane and coiled-coil domain-containing protein 4-like isoform X1 [Gossypium australe]
METMKYLLHLLLVCRWWQEDLSISVLSTGLAGIQPVQFRGIENVDATEYVEGHSSYLWRTKEILRQLDVDNYNAIFRTTQQAKPLQDQTKQTNIGSGGRGDLWNRKRIIRPSPVSFDAYSFLEPPSYCPPICEELWGVYKEDGECCGTQSPELSGEKVVVFLSRSASTNGNRPSSL